MDDKLKQFFNENNFDVHEPHSGHEDRFLRKLQHPKKKSLPYKWMGLVASILLLIGFYVGSTHQKNQFDLRDVSPQMAETQTFFVNAIHQELKTVERYRNLDNETLIENALDEIEELEERYGKYKAELNSQGNQRLKIKAMIQNYQQRLEILEALLEQLETIKYKQQKMINNEVI